MLKVDFTEAEIGTNVYDIKLKQAGKIFLNNACEICVEFNALNISYTLSGMRNNQIEKEPCLFFDNPFKVGFEKACKPVEEKEYKWRMLHGILRDLKPEMTEVLDIACINVDGFFFGVKFLYDNQGEHFEDIDDLGLDFYIKNNLIEEVKK